MKPKKTNLPGFTAESILTAKVRNVGNNLTQNETINLEIVPAGCYATVHRFVERDLGLPHWLAHWLASHIC